MFDDTDPDESTYLGIAKIPLITLAHDKPIQGTFELARVFTYVLFHILISSLDPRVNTFLYGLDIFSDFIANLLHNTYTVCCTFWCLYHLIVALIYW